MLSLSLFALAGVFVGLFLTSPDANSHFLQLGIAFSVVAVFFVLQYVREGGLKRLSSIYAISNKLSQKHTVVCHWEYEESAQFRRFLVFSNPYRILWYIAEAVIQLILAGCAFGILSPY